MNQALYFLYHFVHVFLLEQFDYNPKVSKFSKELTMTTVLFAVEDTVALYFPLRFSPFYYYQIHFKKHNSGSSQVTLLTILIFRMLTKRQIQINPTIFLI